MRRLAIALLISLTACEPSPTEPPKLGPGCTLYVDLAGGYAVGRAYAKCPAPEFVKTWSVVDDTGVEQHYRVEWDGDPLRGLSIR